MHYHLMLAARVLGVHRRRAHAKECPRVLAHVLTGLIPFQC